MKKWAFVFLLLLGIDALSKALVLEYVPFLGPKSIGYPYDGIPIFSFFGITGSLNMVGNTGAAWSLFQDHSSLLFSFRLALIVGLIVYLLFFNRNKMNPLPLWLVVIGAIGNVIDYWTYGYVVDFFHVCFGGHSFPIFNLADSYITIGIAILLWLTRKEKWQTSTP
ncbi:MAG: signal peptidase II [Verrucomicrobiota bacterium]|nr:signal peptidase II [Verrucomicrobiota bacterium]